MFVLVDPRTGTVATGDNLVEAHTRMLARHPGADEDTGTTGSPPTSSRSWVRPAALVGLLVVAALPFVWLSVLHYSLGRMLADLRPHAPKAAERDRGSDDPVVVELKRLHHLVATLDSRVDAVERAGGGSRRSHREGTADSEDSADGSADDPKNEDERSEDEPQNSPKADPTAADAAATDMKPPGAVPPPRGPQRRRNSNPAPGAP